MTKTGFKYATAVRNGIFCGEKLGEETRGGSLWNTEKKATQKEKILRNLWWE